MSHAVAISGAGCLCAAGMTLNDSLQSMLQGRRNPQPPAAFKTSHPETFPVLRSVVIFLRREMMTNC